MQNPERVDADTITPSKGTNSSQSRREKLQNIEYDKFERLVAGIWESQGWKTQISPDSNDRGVDIEAWAPGMGDQKVAIQAKQYADSTRVGQSEIQQYHSLKEQDQDVKAVVFMTTSAFTDSAIVWATKHNIKLINWNDLLDLVDGHGRNNLVNQFAPEVNRETSAESANSGSEQDNSRAATESDVSTTFAVFENKIVRIVLLTIIILMVLSLIEDVTASAALTTLYPVW